MVEAGTVLIHSPMVEAGIIILTNSGSRDNDEMRSLPAFLIEMREKHNCLDCLPKTLARFIETLVEGFVRSSDRIFGSS